MSLWGNTDQSSDEPKFGSALNANTSATVEVYGVDATEIGNAQGTAYQGTHAGWVGIATHTDMHGNLRVKQEVLVAMGSITGDQANDDTLFTP